MQDPDKGQKHRPTVEIRYQQYSIYIDVMLGPLCQVKLLWAWLLPWSKFVKAVQVYCVQRNVGV